MAAQEIASCTSLAVKISTLVLISDAEYDLEVSASHVVFANWSQHGELTKQTLIISLVSRENADDDDVCLPLVITVPFTPRFKVSGPAALVSPFMPLLKSTCPLEYTVEFIRPQVTESDYVWDNFQDQIVIQTRLSKLVVQLQAVKESSSSNSQPTETQAFFFFPQSLLEIKAPSLKLFEFIEKHHRNPSNEQASTIRRSERVSESFNSSKKTSESALVPLRPRTPAALVALPAISSSRPSSSASSSERIQTLPLGPGSFKPIVPASPFIAAAEVSNQMEAKAIILKLRARNSTRHGAHPLSPSTDHGSEHSHPPDESFPESQLDARTKAELDEFNHLVVSAKVGVMNDQASAKSELDYYRQFLPRAPPESGDVVATPSGIVTPREGSTATTSSLAQLLITAPVDRKSSTPSAVTASIAPARRTKPLAVNKVPAKLPSLPALSSIAQAGASCSSSALLEVENNQETSPVRVSAVNEPLAPSKKPHVSQAARPTPPPALQKTAATAAIATLKTTAVSALRAKASGSETGSNNNSRSMKTGSSNNTTSKPSTSSSSAFQQRLEKRNSAKTQSQVPVGKLAVTAKAKIQQHQRAKMREPEAALSDFDDPDPEVDDVPILPDDLGGMRASHGYGDDADDEY